MYMTIGHKKRGTQLQMSDPDDYCDYSSCAQGKHSKVRTYHLSDKTNTDLSDLVKPQPWS